MSLERYNGLIKNGPPPKKEKEKKRKYPVSANLSEEVYEMLCRLTQHVFDSQVTAITVAIKLLFEQEKPPKLKIKRKN